MTITNKVQRQFFEREQQTQQLIRIAQDARARTHGPSKRSGTPWTADEHDRFLAALEQYPSGPWKVIAWSVGTRTTRQTMTHAQKYREKIARHKRVDEQTEALKQCCSSGFAHSATVPASVDTDAAATATAGAIKCEFGADAATSNVNVNYDHTAASSLDDLSMPSNMHSDGVTAGTDDMLDATIALLLDAYEPLDIESSSNDDDDDESFWRDLEAFAHTL